MLDGLIFDKDGTLFDFRISWGGWAAGFLDRMADGPAHAARLAAAIGYDPGAQSFHPTSPVIAATADDIARALLPELPGWTLPALTETIDRSAAQAPMAEVVPLRPLLLGFRARGLKLGLATNDSEAPARQHLASHGITDCFDFIAGYDSGHGAKPGPGMCLAFAALLDLDPARVAMVGDSRHDLLAGRAAGMRAVAVLTGIASAADLAPLAETVLPDIGALPDWLERLDA
jgi:phosphoglycolate phosphatase